MSIDPLCRFVAVYKTRRGVHLSAIAFATHELASALPRGPNVPRELEIVDVVEVRYAPRAVGKPTCICCNDTLFVVDKRPVEHRGSVTTAYRRVPCPNCNPAGHGAEQLAVDHRSAVTPDNFDQVLTDVLRDMNADDAAAASTTQEDDAF